MKSGRLSHVDSVVKIIRRETIFVKNHPNLVKISFFTLPYCSFHYLNGSSDATNRLDFDSSQSEILTKLIEIIRLRINAFTNNQNILSFLTNW